MNNTGKINTSIPDINDIFYLISWIHFKFQAFFAALIWSNVEERAQTLDAKKSTFNLGFGIHLQCASVKYLFELTALSVESKSQFFTLFNLTF